MLNNAAVNSSRWRKYYFATKDGFLLWYVSRAYSGFDRPPRAILPLNGCFVEISSDNPCVLELIHPDIKQFHVFLKAKSRDDASKWLEALKTAKKASWENANLGAAMVEALEMKGSAIQEEKLEAVKLLEKKAAEINKANKDRMKILERERKLIAPLEEKLERTDAAVNVYLQEKNEIEEAIKAEEEAQKRIAQSKLALQNKLRMAAMALRRLETALSYELNEVEAKHYHRVSGMNHRLHSKFNNTFPKQGNKKGRSSTLKSFNSNPEKKSQHMTINSQNSTSSKNSRYNSINSQWSNSSYKSRSNSMNSTQSQASGEAKSFWQNQQGAMIKKKKQRESEQRQRKFRQQKKKFDNQRKQFENGNHKDDSARKKKNSFNEVEIQRGRSRSQNNSTPSGTHVGKMRNLFQNASVKRNEKTGVVKLMTNNRQKYTFSYNGKGKILAMDEDVGKHFASIQSFFEEANSLHKKKQDVLLGKKLKKIQQTLRRPKKHSKETQLDDFYDFEDVDV